jgi:hypothetical protein
MSKKIRVFYFLLSTLFLEWANYYVRGNFDIPGDSHLIWMQAGFLSLILGVLLTEHFHTKPTDAILTSLSLFFITHLLQNPPYEFYWNLLNWLCILVFLGSLFLLGVEKSENVGLLSKISKTVYLIIKEIGSSKILCTYAYILGVISFVDSEKQSILLIGWIVLFLVFVGKPHRIFITIKNLWIGTSLYEGRSCGYVIRFEDPNLVFVELTHNSEINGIIALCPTPIFEADKILFAMVVKVFRGNDKTIVRAIILDNQREKWSGQSNIFINNFGDEKFASSQIYIKRNKLIGFIGSNSEIGKQIIHFYDDKNIVENLDIVEVTIGSKKILYQITNAIVNEEILSGEVYGFKKVIGVQIGIWDTTKCCFIDYKWVPPLNAIVYKSDSFLSRTQCGEGLLTIGTFNTGHPITVKIAELITHNTAILGVTGSGKSCMGYSIIEGIINNGIKTICIDNTGDYIRHVQHDNKKTINNPSEIDAFLESQDLFAVVTAPNVASALNIIQKVYEWAQECYDPEQNEIVPRICILMEEAHSLIPEWNSVVQQNDRDLVNRISTLIMQGRKYGCGVIVVTQRTANVTKSVLSQCNTIISFQAFDKTSNDFVSSFMDEEYVSTICRLGNGCAVIAGKALTSGRPVAIKSIIRE